MDTLFSNMLSLLISIDDSLEKGHVLPCMILLYSGIDALASLDAEDGRASRESFINWADKYLLSNGDLPCTAIELYAARCGLLHTFSFQSDLSRKGQARKIVYSCRTASADDLAEVIAYLGENDCVAVHINTLVSVFKAATVKYLDEIESSVSKLERAQLLFAQWPTKMDKKTVEQFLREIKS